MIRPRTTKLFNWVTAGGGICKIGGDAGILLGLCFSRTAADPPAGLPVKAPARSAIYGWTGFYLGGHFGYGGGSIGPDTNPLPLQGVFFPHSVTGLIGGYQAGYIGQLANNVVLGVEADVSFGSPVDVPRLVPAPFDTTIDYIATGRGRVGYAMGTWMPYVTGGFAWGSTNVSLNDLGTIVPPKRYLTHLGWTAGLGVEVAVGGNWTAKAEYDYIDLARRTYDLTDVGLPRVNVDPNIHLFKLGLNYRLWETPPWAGPAPVDGRTALAEPTNWNVHGQTTVIMQGYPRMRSPYEGTNSLPGGGQGRETWTADAFLGWRLWQGGEFYFNPELAQGFGLNSTLGLAGFSNGEAQKGGTTYPRFRPQRYIFRQTFGLGGEQEEVADGPMQLAGKRDIDRVTVTLGRFAIGDYFDGNSYAKDPRVDFMNWAMWSSAAYDFPADLPGFTRGAVVELNRKDWAVRAGLFQVPSLPTATCSCSRPAARSRIRRASHDLRSARQVAAGCFRQPRQHRQLPQRAGDHCGGPDARYQRCHRRHPARQPKYGFYVNAEQQVMKDVGVFARASWNDGQNQILSFTDIDRSVSGGLSVKGSYWGRPSDTIGIGGAVNGLSAAHSDFLAAGGLGLLIGDGRLNYGHERIFETYYAFAIDKSFTFTADYQFITNPAYNADRGPVHIFSGRLHGEF